MHGRRDLERMKVPTGLLTPRQQAKQQQAAMEEAENQVALANARNSRMIEVSLALGFRDWGGGSGHWGRRLCRG